MPYQPTRKEVERVRAAQRAQAEAEARLAEAQLQRTVATQELDSAIDALIRGPLSVTGQSQGRQTQYCAAEHPSL